MTNSPDRRGNPPVTAWRTQTIGDLSDLAQARVEAINVVQWLARIANSYVFQSTPERRISLEFRAHDAVIVTPQFVKAIALETRLPGLELQFLDNGEPMPHVFDPEEHSPAEIEAWILVELLHRGIDREKFTKELPYAIPGLMSGDAEDYSPQLCREGLVCLTGLMQDAAAVLDAAAGGKTDREPCVSCLPQTLDLVSPANSIEKPAHFGFSPGGPDSSEPYFYVVDAGDGSGCKRSLAVEASIIIAERNPAAAAAKLRNLAFG